MAGELSVLWIVTSGDISNTGGSLLMGPTHRLCDDIDIRCKGVKSGIWPPPRPPPPCLPPPSE